MGQPTGAAAWWKHDVVAFNESQAANGLTAFAAVADPRYKTAGDQQTIRDLVSPKISLAAGFGSNLARLQLRNATAFDNINPEFDGYYDNASNVRPSDLWDTPVPLAPNDVIECFMDNANNVERDVALLRVHYGAVHQWIPFRPQSFRRVFGVRYALSTPTAQVWSAHTQTPTGLRPDRNYMILGTALFGGTDTVAGRMVFTETPLTPGIANYRPGIPANPGTTLRTSEMAFQTRVTWFGAHGIPFQGLSAPTWETLSTGTTTPIVFMYLGEM